MIQNKLQKEGKTKQLYVNEEVKHEIDQVTCTLSITKLLKANTITPQCSNHCPVSMKFLIHVTKCSVTEAFSITKLL